MNAYNMANASRFTVPCKNFQFNAHTALILILLFMLFSAPPFNPSINATPSEEPAMQIGSTLRYRDFKDQHGNWRRIGSEHKKILFVNDMDASRIVHAVFSSTDADYMDRRGIALIADIHRMPAIISRMIAVPRMQDYTYRILLIRDAGPGSVFPARAGTITILTLDALQVSAVDYARDEQELRAALNMEPSPQSD